MTFRRKYEDLVQVNSMHIKEAFAKANVKQCDFANEVIGVSPEHFSRCIKKGELYQQWVDQISDVCDISSEYITGVINTPVSRFGEKRNVANSIDGLKQFILSRGFQPELIDNLDEFDIDEIEYFISYKCKHPKTKIFPSIIDVVETKMNKEEE